MDAMSGEYNVKEWRSVYTTYFNKEFTIAEGRRVAKDKCVSNPNIHLIKYAVEALGLKCFLDICAKHPRDFFNNGRLRVQLTDEKTN